MRPQLYMSMHGLNNNVQHQRTTSTTRQHQRLDDNHDNVQLQYDNLIDIHHVIATSYNHHV